MVIKLKDFDFTFGFITTYVIFPEEAGRLVETINRGGLGYSVDQATVTKLIRGDYYGEEVTFTTNIPETVGIFEDLLARANTPIVHDVEILFKIG